MKQRFLWTVLLLVVCPAAAHAQEAGSRAVWVELTGRGASVRAVVPAGAACPVVSTGKKKIALTERAGSPSADGAFPVKACAVDLPATVTNVSFEGHTLSTASKAQRIVVIGDTGCRITSKEVQDCEKDWPFAKIAGFAAARKPDLIIHVGDYYYRESCPDGGKHCESWENWRKDFFAPAAPLFAAAPWVLARGNHESCGRAAEGWFRLLDAGATPLQCPADGKMLGAAPYAVKLPGLTLAVADSADIVDTQAIVPKMEIFQADVTAAAPPANVPVWIVTHKPPYEGGLMSKRSDAAEGPEATLPPVQMVVAGHIHMFGALDFAGVRPAELIVGDSGTALNGTILKMEKGADPAALLQGTLEVDGKPATYSAKGSFGYMLLERSGNTTPLGDLWKGTLYGTTDEVLGTCIILRRTISCSSPNGSLNPPAGVKVTSETVIVH